MTAETRRDQWRNEHFRHRLKPWQKWVTVKCGACNGSGRYDHNNSRNGKVKHLQPARNQKQRR